MFRDYKVVLLDRDTIARQAAKVRRLARIPPNGLTFDIVHLIEKILPKHLVGGLEIRFFKRCPERNYPAYVSFSPLTLHVDGSVWAMAKAGHGRSRFILAHEIGHLILHQHQEMAFSSGREFQIRYSIDECSAEWQANVFAGYLLLPDEVVMSFETFEQIVEMCDVNEEVARDRVEDLRAKRRRSRRSGEGEACSHCGDLAIIIEGTRVKCGTCGAADISTAQQKRLG